MVVTVYRSNGNVKQFLHICEIELLDDKLKITDKNSAVVNVHMFEADEIEYITVKKLKE